HLSAALVPRSVRPRWREEWLGELRSNFELNTSKFELLRRSLGAPIDAASARIDALTDGWRRLRAGAAHDLRQTIRGLMHSPRHVAMVVGCLAIGITVSVAVFSIVNSLLYGEIPGIVHRRGLVRLFVSHEQVYGQERVGDGIVAAGP